MDMIVTAPLSMVFDSTGKPPQGEPNGRGIRVVEVSVNVNTVIAGDGKFVHNFDPL